jgi:hypothetical protein
MCGLDQSPRSQYVGFTSVAAAILAAVEGGIVCV